jgi:hypothetical protein
MPSLSTAYKNADEVYGDGFIRDEPRGSRGDFFRLHRDYLRGLDSQVVKKLPWPTLEEKYHVNQLLQQRAWAKLGWTRGVTGSVYSVLISIVATALFASRIRRGGEDEMRKEMLRAIGISLAVWNVTLMLGSLSAYCFYSSVDHQIQELVRQLMDDNGIAAPFHQQPMMHRDDSNQLAIFELPEFINVMWQKASSTSSQHNAESFVPPPSDHISSITT